jgi:phosphoribosylanthranilate isomerase
MTWIKICGITNLEDAMDAASLGVDALGFLFAPSPRRIAPSEAREIIGALPKAVEKVGVFVDENPDEVARIARLLGLDTLQFHGQESPEYCRRFSQRVIKAMGVKSSESLKEMGKYSFVSLLLDAFSKDRAGGIGKTFNWEWAYEFRQRRDFILSGGLNPGNVYQAIHLLRPMGVDVSSGVEMAPGKKDLLKMMEFVKEVRRADETT